jgi:hypothetical protein
MLWKIDKIPEKTPAIMEYKARCPQARYLLVLNEPNHKGQANTTPQEAAQLWPQLEELARECCMDLVGPQLCYGHMEGYESPVSWLNAFIAEYKARNGDRYPRIDALGYHFYGSHGLRKHLDDLKCFGKPLWVTEFAYYHAMTLEDQMQWMTKAVALCENRTDVVRYSWFIGRADEKPLIRLRNGEVEYYVGAMVDARYKGGKNWYPGVISAVHINETYDIDYVDGNKETGVAKFSKYPFSLLAENGTLNELGKHYVGLPYTTR